MLHAAMFALVLGTTFDPPVPPSVPDPSWGDPFARPTPPPEQPVPPAVRPEPPAVPASPQPPASGVNVSGCLDIPGVGRVCAGDGNTPSNSAGASDAGQAKVAVHALAIDGLQKSRSTFQDYTHEREALKNIRLLASQYQSDGILNAVYLSASETLNGTSEDWDPFDAPKLQDRLEAIVQLSR